MRGRLHQALDRSIPEGAPVALIGVPRWTNVGDHAIFLGTLAYLRRRGCELRYLAAGLSDFSAGTLRRRLPEDGLVLLHGGGSLTDIWPRSLELHQRALLDAADRRVVQLPQSAYFESAEAGRRLARTVRAHGAVELLIRDSASLERIEGLGLSGRLCPDIALALDAVPRPPAPVQAIAAMLREDGESALQGAAEIPEGMLVPDWAAPDPLRSRIGPSLAYRAARVTPAAPALGRVALASWRRYSKRRLARGVELISRGRVCVTDRLHAHLLCLMVGVPNVVVDNSYGKLHEFARTWGLPDESVRLVDTIPEALEVAAEISARGR